MGVHKNKSPILEFDDNPKSVIMPGYGELNLKLPKKCVYAFLGEYIEEFANKNNGVNVAEFDSITKRYPIYVINYRGEKICLVQGQILFTADSLADIQKYDSRNFGKDSYEYALMLCMETVLKL